MIYKTTIWGKILSQYYTSVVFLIKIDWFLMKKVFKKRKMKQNRIDRNFGTTHDHWWPPSVSVNLKTQNQLFCNSFKMDWHWYKCLVICYVEIYFSTMTFDLIWIFLSFVYIKAETLRLIDFSPWLCWVIVRGSDMYQMCMLVEFWTETAYFDVEQIATLCSCHAHIAIFSNNSDSWDCSLPYYIALERKKIQ